MFQFHYNLYGIDADFNPVVMSIKPHENKLLVVVRTKESSKSFDFVENEINSGDYVWLSKQLYPSLQIDHFDNCTHYKAQQHVKAFDEKLEIQKFKFGVIYQRRGQVRVSPSLTPPTTFALRFRPPKKSSSTTTDIIEPSTNFSTSSPHASR